MGEQRRFHLGGKDGVAAAQDQLALPPLDAHQAVRRQRGEVAGLEPALLEDGAGLIGRVEVAVEPGRALDPELAGVTRDERPSRVVDHAELDARHGAPDRVRAIARVTREVGDRTEELGHPEAAEEADAGAPLPLVHQRATGRGRRPTAPGGGSRDPRRSKAGESSTRRNMVATPGNTVARWPATAASTASGSEALEEHDRRAGPERGEERAVRARRSARTAACRAGVKVGGQGLGDPLRTSPRERIAPAEPALERGILRLGVGGRARYLHRLGVGARPACLQTRGGGTRTR